MKQLPTDWQALREKLADMPKSAAWRSLNEVVQGPEFVEWLEKEFPRGAAVWEEGISRRRFLQLMAASLGLAGLTACVGRQSEAIVPYVEQPEEVVPGEPLYFATAHLFNGYSRGILVESHTGRPTKIEGNPEHPDSWGATDVFAQASLVSLYDPDRSQTVSSEGRIRTWSEFDSVLAQTLTELRGNGGAGFRILTPTVTSPTLAAQLAAVLELFPQAQWHQYQPLNGDNVYAGTEVVFGEALEPRYDFSQAAVILALDADFLFAEPGHLAYTHDYSERRKVRVDSPDMNRLYVVESTPTLTGSMADHRLPLSPAQIENFARHLAAELGLDVETGGTPGGTPEDIFGSWVAAVAADLNENPGSCLVIAGDNQPPAVQALAHVMNVHLGNVGQTVVYSSPVPANPENQAESLRRLAADMSGGAVEFLLILDSNPVYHTPGDIDFAAALGNVPLSVHLGLYENETGVRCTWHLPQYHYLEAWGDARAYDGTITIMQPLIEPLYNGRSAHELLAIILGNPGRSSLDVVAGFWQERAAAGEIDIAETDGAPEDLEAPGGEEVETGQVGEGEEPLGGEEGGLDTEQEGEEEGGQEGSTGTESGGADAAADARVTTWWERVLQLGFVPGTALPPVAVTLGGLDLGGGPATEPAGRQLIFRPSYTVWDGSYSNNAWLQETPQPFTKLTWDNAALISPTMAAALGLENEDVVVLSVDGREVAAPVWIMPGQVENCVTVYLGYGRTHSGEVGRGVGFNAYLLRSSAEPWYASGLEVRPTGEEYELAVTQDHHVMAGRNLVKAAPLEVFWAEPDFVHEGEGERPSLYPEFVYDGYAWGMSIDLNLCIGCNACTVACQAENNIPVVGKEGVIEGREMHWIRVDGYFKGDLENPELLHQPIPCMHCEKAPCEPVCPVAATSHSSEGLNEMTYNRCVGTRYCSNNCPYKVRRFNFFDYGGDEANLLAMAHNPDVTVRARGVMEKCTYCVQRINQARIDAKVENRPIRDGEIQTACQQVCPAQAIVFGDLSDENTQVRQLREQPHSYGLLAELNTQPRTSYLGRLRNLNPALVGEEEEAE